MRGQYRRVLITLSEDLKKLYFDNEGNPVFQEWLLEEESSSEDDTSRSKNEVSEKKRSLQSVTKDMVVEKFTGIQQNAGVWLRVFVNKCNRVKVETDQRVEALCLFHEGSPSEWFQANWKLAKKDTNWENWSSKFLEAFNEKGWSEIWYANNYKWQSGATFSEYAIKKKNLLIDANPTSQKNHE